MKTSKKGVRVVLGTAVAALILSAGMTNASAQAGAAVPAAVALSGAQQVPPAPTKATGTSTISVGPDKMVKGAVKVTGMTATAAHIHEAAQGANGPVIVPFVKISDNNFAPAPGAKMTDAQYASYLAGNTYVNVHSATYPGGEIRVQLAPAK